MYYCIGNYTKLDELELLRDILVPLSTKTKDKYLKWIRILKEQLHCSYLEEMLDKYGYTSWLDKFKVV